MHADPETDTYCLKNDLMITIGGADLQKQSASYECLVSDSSKHSSTGNADTVIMQKRLTAGLKQLEASGVLFCTSASRADPASSASCKMTCNAHEDLHVQLLQQPCKSKYLLQSLKNLPACERLE